MSVGNACPDTIVLLSLDCVRREAISCFPYRFSPTLSPNTPTIDMLAHSGVRFDRAITQAPFTPASHGSIFTGLNPYAHGIRAMVGYQLNPRIPTLAEILHDHGFATAAFIGSHALGREYGLCRGFEVYDDEFSNPTSNWLFGSRRSCEESTQNAIRWLAEQSTPSLLFLHYFDAHDIPGDLTTAKPQFQIEQMKRIDAQVARLVDALDRMGRFDRTLFIIFSDHGDAFGEHHEYSHREYLYDTTLIIPLIVNGGDFKGGYEVASQIRAIDIFPTILETVGLSPEKSLHGMSFTNFQSSAKDRFAYSETCYEKSPTNWFEYKSSLASFRQKDWKFIVNRLTGEFELYYLPADAGEKTNLAELHPAFCDQSLSEMREMISENFDAGKDMSNSELSMLSERLKSLGYLD